MYGQCVRADIYTYTNVCTYIDSETERQRQHERDRECSLIIPQMHALYLTTTTSTHPFPPPLKDISPSFIALPSMLSFLLS